MHDVDELNQDAYKVSQILHWFERLKTQQLGEGLEDTKPFDRLSHSVQKQLMSEFDLQDGEVPALAYYKETDTWFLFTSRRVAWSRPGYKSDIEYCRINRMGWSSGPAGEKERSAPDSVDDLIESPNGLRDCKTDSPWFFIFDTTEIRHEVLLQPGPLVCAIWNCIRRIRKVERSLEKNNLSR